MIIYYGNYNFYTSVINTRMDVGRGGLLNPQLFCKPIAKRYEDREALREVAPKWTPKGYVWFRL